MFPPTSSNDCRLVSSSNSSSSSSFSSSSSSSSSSPLSPSSTPSFSLPPNTKSMEEVWKDITISSLPTTPLPHHHHHHHHHRHLNHHHHPTPTSDFRGIILQDFLNARDPPIRAVDSTIDGCPLPPPATVLSLNSGPEFQFLDINSQCNNLQGSPVQSFPVLGAGGAAFDALASSSVLTSFGGGLGKKRFPETQENGSVDRRHKRMIKNRESAARSRARKQAYVQELEIEITHLQEEIARLKKQQQQIMAAPCVQLPKRHGLQRASTAPF